MNAAEFSLVDPINVDQITILAGQLQSKIVPAWQNNIRRSIKLNLSDENLMEWLERCFGAFVEKNEREIDPGKNCVFADFASVLQTAGAAPDDVFETLILLRDAVETCSNPQLGGDKGIEPARLETAIPQLRTWSRRITAATLTSYMDHRTVELKRQPEKIASLLRVAQAASSSLALHEVLKVISEEVVRVLDAWGCNAFLFPERSKYGYYYLIEPMPPLDYKVPDPPDRFTMDALIRKEPVTCYDAMLDPRTDKRTMKYFGITSAMAFPLVFQGKAVAAGFVSMKHYHHFTQEEIDLVMGIANSGAMAVENARLHEISMQYAVAEERNRLAQEMHDNLAQALAVIKMDINSILREDLCPPAQETLLDMKTLVDETYIDLRDTIFGLRAINEIDTHFLDNFKNYLNTFGVHSGLIIQISIEEDDLQVLSREALLQVGRILEEALTNVRKHANARHIWINGGKDDQTLWITVEDDGNGIDPEIVATPMQGHFGLQVMAERAAGVGGRFHISSRAEGGTCARLEIPYP